MSCLKCNGFRSVGGRKHGPTVCFIFPFVLPYFSGPIYLTCEYAFFKIVLVVCMYQLLNFDDYNFNICLYDFVSLIKAICDVKGSLININSSYHFVKINIKKKKEKRPQNPWFRHQKRKPRTVLDQKGTTI